MSKLFGKTPKAPDPQLMPDPDNQAIKDARAAELVAARQRSGRASTILTGTDAYTGTKTGVQ